MPQGQASLLTLTLHTHNPGNENPKGSNLYKRFRGLWTMHAGICDLGGLAVILPKHMQSKLQIYTCYSNHFVD